MQVWRSLEDVPRELTGSVVAIGVFDGVHRGHRVILDRAVAAARELRLPAVVVTFDPHPASVVRPQAAPLMLTSLDGRLAALADCGVDATLVVPFTVERSQQSAADFVDDVLVDSLRARRVVVGANFRFGHKAAGDVVLLQRAGEGHRFDVDPVPLLAASGADVVSSTAVRTMVAAGEVAAAAGALGRPHRVEGLVVRGDRRGRELGFPTANVEVPAGTAVPLDGVYAGRLVLPHGESLPAAVSVGTNPTFDGTERRVEAYVLDRDDLDLYGERVAVEFVDRLRGQERFADVAALVERMKQDIATIRRMLDGEGRETPPH